jgi:acetyltransferase-like isoleucine patch superfamily enzyme
VEDSSEMAVESTACTVQVDQLRECLRALLQEERAHSVEALDRSLPFGEYISERWDRANQLGFGQGSSVYDSSIIMGSVTVGENTWIGPYTLLDASGGLQIGSFCSISAGVQVYSHDSVRWAVTGGAEAIEYSPVTIGSRVYIGPNTIVARGVTVGDGAVIGANSFVNADVPAGSRVWGNPARMQGVE